MKTQTVTVQVLGEGKARVRRATWGDDGRLQSKDFLDASGRWLPVEPAQEVPPECILDCEGRVTDARKTPYITITLSYDESHLRGATRIDITTPLSAGDIKEVWVDGVRFVLDEKATLEHLYEVLKKRDD